MAHGRPDELRPDPRRDSRDRSGAVRPSVVAGGAGAWPTSRRRGAVLSRTRRAPIWGGPGDSARVGRRGGTARRALVTPVGARRGTDRSRWQSSAVADVPGPAVRVGVGLALAQRAESRAAKSVDIDATPAMAADERVHEEVGAWPGRPRPRPRFGHLPGRGVRCQRRPGRNLSLVLGVVGGGASTTTVLLTGLAGLLSGALSMGAGEYVSVRSQRELLAASSPDVSDAHTVLPRLDLDANELALVYRARGYSADEARLQRRCSPAQR